MSEWISVEEHLPNCIFEHEGKMVSQSVEVTDGESWARGHLVDDETWVIYESNYDFLTICDDDVSHWSPMMELPD